MATVMAHDRTHVVLTNGGTVVAYLAHRSGFEGEHWFTGITAPENVRKAAMSAIFLLDGVPSADRLAREINTLLAGE